MVDGADGRSDGTELQAVARALGDTVPLLVERLSRARPGRIYREALELLERPLLEHVLAMTGGNQLRAARVLGAHPHPAPQARRGAGGGAAGGAGAHPRRAAGGRPPAVTAR